MTSADNLNESNRSVYDTCDPDYLRQLRAASGVEETWLARTACLSVAQVRQLEEGGESLFYSLTIKRQAYKRLLMILGAEPPTVVVDIVEQPVPSVVNDLNEIIAMGEKRLNDDHALAEFFRSGPFKVPVGFKAFPLKATRTRRRAAGMPASTSGYSTFSNFLYASR